MGHWHDMVKHDHAMHTIIMTSCTTPTSISYKRGGAIIIDTRLHHILALIVQSLRCFVDVVRVYMDVLNGFEQFVVSRH